MSVETIISSVQAFEYGAILNEAGRLEESVRAGGNSYFTAAFQTLQAHKALGFADHAFEAVGREKLSLPVRAIVYLSPVLVTLLSKLDIKNETARFAVIVLQDQIGNVCRVVALVSSAVMIYFGSTAFGITSLIVLSIGICDQKGLLPERVRQIMHEYLSPVLFASSFFSGSIVDQLFATLNIVSFCASRYFQWKAQKSFAAIEQEMPEGRLSHIQLQAMLASRRTLHVNREYLNFAFSPLPAQIPEIDIEAFATLFQQVEWNESNITALRRKLSGDQRFVLRNGNPSQKTDQELIDIVRQSLRSLIDSVKGHRILAGEPKDYELLLKYLKLIASHLQKEDNPIARQDILLRLAIEAGEYCGPGIYDVAEDIYSEIRGENGALSFASQLLGCAQDARNQAFEQFYHLLFFNPKYATPPIRFLGKVMDWQDRHQYHFFVNLYGNEFRLRAAGADNDEIAFIDPLYKMIVSYFLSGVVKNFFWRMHGADQLVEVIGNAIGTSRLPKPVIYDWWRGWINRQNITAEEKEKLVDELSSSAALYGEPLEIDRKVNPRFIKAMLVDCGLLM